MQVEVLIRRVQLPAQNLDPRNLGSGIPLWRAWTLRLRVSTRETSMLEASPPLRSCCSSRKRKRRGDSR